MYGGDAAGAEGRDWVDLWPAASRPAAAAALRDACQGRPARFKAPREREGGAQSWWDVSLTALSRGDDPTTLVISRDVTALIAQAERLDIVNAEMRHRLRNAFTIATSLTILAARDEPEHRVFADRLVAAFRQYVAVQEVVLDPRAAKSFDKLLPMIMKAFGDRKMFEYGAIPPIDLPDGSVQALALSFGELCTNSLKHGGLRDGRPVRLDVAVTPDTLEVVWNEATHFGRPRDGGQGLALIDRMVAVVGGSVQRNVTSDTLVTAIRLPHSDRRYA
jgi:two-component sensor histidine kinase